MQFTPENVEAVNAEYARMRAGFKPEFGNLDHINFIKLLDRVKHDEDLAQKHEDAMKKTSIYKKKSFEAKVRAINQLKFIMSRVGKKQNENHI